MDDRSTTAVVRELGIGIYGLVKGEIQLARAELTQNARDMSRHGARIGAYAGAIFFGAFALLAFAVVGLGDLLGDRYWLSSLIVGLLLVVPSALLIRSSVRQIKGDASLKETRHSIQEDQELFSGKIHHLNDRRKGTS